MDPPVDRWTPLVAVKEDGGALGSARLVLHRGLQNASASAQVATQLAGHFADLARGSALVNDDFKPTDLLVRQLERGGALEVRLSDVDVGGPGGLMPGLEPGCALQINLRKLLSQFACGPLRKSPLAREVVRSLWGTIEGRAWPTQQVQPTGSCNYTRLLDDYNWHRQRNKSFVDKCHVVGMHCGFMRVYPHDVAFGRLHELRRRSGGSDIFECPAELTFDQLGRLWNRTYVGWPLGSMLHAATRQI
jgi:hypothetical protein